MDSLWSLNAPVSVDRKNLEGWNIQYKSANNHYIWDNMQSSTIFINHYKQMLTMFCYESNNLLDGLKAMYQIFERT